MGGWIAVAFWGGLGMVGVVWLLWFCAGLALVTLREVGRKLWRLVHRTT